MKRTATFLFGLCIVASSCDPDDDDPEPPDGGVVADAAAMDAPTGIDAPGPDSARMADAAPTDAPEPARCQAGSACNQRLVSDGRCPGDCVAISERLTCPGQVSAGICLASGALNYPTEAWADPFQIIVTARPEKARVGETHTVKLRLENRAAATATTTASFGAGQTWTLLAGPPRTLTLAPGESAALEATVRAAAASILTPHAWPALTLRLSDTRYSTRGFPVAVPVHHADGELTCAGERFPAFVSTQGTNYGEARCCDGVFYPGANCCMSSDCSSGSACVDGRCTRKVPFFNASTPAVGSVRILVVLLDGQGNAPATDVCADHAAARRAQLDLAAVESFYARVAQARGKRQFSSFHWTVLAGLRPADVPAPSRLPADYGQALEQLLVARGCFPSFDEEFDRVVWVAPDVDLGEYRGRAYDVDRIAQSVWTPEIAAHELAHGFGANDRYLDVGGSLQWARSLMGSSARPLAELSDDVLWGEIGFADANRNGELDLLEFSVVPEELVIDRLVLRASKMAASLTIETRIAGREAGRALTLTPLEVELTLPEHGERFVQNRTNRTEERDLFLTYAVAGIHMKAQTLEQLIASRRARVVVRVRHRFTAADARRATVSLDKTIEMPVEVLTGSENPGPIPLPGPRTLAGCD